MAVWVWKHMMHELGTHWSESRSGFPLHKVCVSPAARLRPGAKYNSHNKFVKSLIVASRIRIPIRSRFPLNISLRLAGLTSRGVWLASRLLSSARCQTSWIPRSQHKFQHPTMASGDGTAVLVPVHQKDGRFHLLCACLSLHEGLAVLILLSLELANDQGALFFWAHAVRARGSDGHQNVLS